MCNSVVMETFEMIVIIKEIFPCVLEEFYGLYIEKMDREETVTLIYKLYLIRAAALVINPWTDVTIPLDNGNLIREIIKVMRMCHNKNSNMKKIQERNYNIINFVSSFVTTIKYINHIITPRFPHCRLLRTIFFYNGLALMNDVFRRQADINYSAIGFRLTLASITP